MFGLIYGLYTLISLNWNDYIFPTIISPISLIISNIILFINNNLKIFSLVVILINIWISCVNYKISERFKKTPLSLSMLSIFSIVITFSLSVFNLAERNFLISFTLMFFLMIFVIVHNISLKEVENYNDKLKKDNEKLMKINKNDKQLSFDF